jgi:signal peptidase I
MSESQSKRNPWVAVALSLVYTGLGHLYCGRIVRGLVLFCASLLFAPFALGLALIPAATPVLVVLILAFAAMIGLYAFAVMDACRLARSSRESFTPRDYNHPIVYLLLGLVGLVYPPMAVTYLRGHAFEAFYIPTSSMAPTILDGDRILANKVVPASWMPERGDVVIFRVPDRRDQNWIKRVIGLPGDRVAVRGGEVFVNGKKLERDRVPDSHLTGLGKQVRGEVFTENLAGRRYLIQMGGREEKADDYAEKTVPEGRYFLLGDNRDNSLDSRGFGFVARGEMIGEAAYVYLPAESWSRFGILRP